MSQSIFFWLILGSSLSASVNLLMRFSVDSTPRPYGMLIFYFFFGLVISLWMGPWQAGLHASWNLLVFFLGIAGGLLNLLVPLLTALALARGPAGLTLAFQNAGAVASSYILWGLFGKSYGFNVNWATFLGSGLVVAGLVLGATDNQATKKSGSFSWLIYAFSALCAQGFSLSFLHWMSLLGKAELVPHPLLLWYIPFNEQVWFIPGMFFGSLMLQLAIFFIQQKRALRASEIFYGSLAGILNALATLILVRATRQATSQEKLLIFPCFAVSVVLLCNLWEWLIYRRPINWPANLLCCLGILVAVLYSAW